MSDYISRDEIFSVWRSMPKPASISSLTDAINRTPAADVEPVRRGEWIIIEDEYFGHAKCSVCGDEFTSWEGDCAITRYCPSCGAKMELEDENDG